MVNSMVVKTYTVPNGTTNHEMAWEPKQSFAAFMEYLT